MKEIFYVLLVVIGLVVGWFVNDYFQSDQTEKVHMTLEKATKYSKKTLMLRERRAE